MHTSNRLADRRYPTSSDLDDLRERLELVPPGRIIAEANDSDAILTLGDLRQYAKFFVREFHHDGHAAARKPASWYQQLVRHCTAEQAELLREMTIELCAELTLLDDYTEEQRALRMRERLSQWWDRLLHKLDLAFEGLSLFLGFLFLFVVVPIAGSRYVSHRLAHQPATSTRRASSRVILQGEWPR